MNHDFSKYVQKNTYGVEGKHKSIGHLKNSMMFEKAIVNVLLGVTLTFIGMIGTTIGVIFNDIKFSIFGLACLGAGLGFMFNYTLILKQISKTLRH